MVQRKENQTEENKSKALGEARAAREAKQRKLGVFGGGQVVSRVTSSPVSLSFLAYLFTGSLWVAAYEIYYW